MMPERGYTPTRLIDLGGDVEAENNVSRSLSEVLHTMNPLQQDILKALLTFDEESDDMIAERHGTTTSAVKLNRSLARLRLQEHMRLRGQECF